MNLNHETQEAPKNMSVTEAHGRTREKDIKEHMGNIVPKYGFPYDPQIGNTKG